jgi:hypothetical protein
VLLSYRLKIKALFMPKIDERPKVDRIFKPEKIVPKNAQKRAVKNPPPPAPYEQGETFAVVGHINFRQKSKRITISPFRFTAEKKSQNFEKGLLKSVETVTKSNRLKISGKKIRLTAKEMVGEKIFKKVKKGYEKSLTKRNGCGKI